MSGAERLFYDMRFGDPERTEFLIATLGNSRIQRMAEKIMHTLEDIRDKTIFKHRYGVGCEAKTFDKILPFVTLSTPNVPAIRKVTRTLTKKLCAPSRVHIVLNEIKGIEY